MWFCKENQAIGRGEGTGMIISRELDNKMKYREEIGNPYNELKHWKKNLFDLLKGVPGKADKMNELTKLKNKWSSKLSNQDIRYKALMIRSSLI